MSGIKKVTDYNLIISDETKQAMIRDYVENFLTIKELVEKYNVTSKIFITKLLGNKKRSLSEAAKLAHKKKPEKFKLSEEAKDKIRTARLKFMKEHPEQTAWRQKNESYPEKCFIKMLSDYGFDKKYLIYKEYSVFPYFIDFAFFNEKVAVEVDGSQHLEPERAESDRKKDLLLLDNGWYVIHFTATDVMKNPSMIAEKLNEFISNKMTCKVEKVGILKAPKEKECKKHSEYSEIIHVGILKAPKTREPIPREENGRTAKQNESAYKSRKVTNRPLKDELFKMICYLPFMEIGRKYGVDGNTIKKWCKNYGLPYKKSDIDKIIGKEHPYKKREIVCDNCGKKFITDNKGGRFCSVSCCNEYNRKHPNESITLRRRHIMKETPNGVLTKRVTDEELQQYLNDGWVIGRKLK